MTRSRSATGLKSTVASDALGQHGVELRLHRSPCRSMVDGDDAAVGGHAIELAVGRAHVDAEQRAAQAGDLHRSWSPSSWSVSTTAMVSVPTSAATWAAWAAPAKVMVAASGEENSSVTSWCYSLSYGRPRVRIVTRRTRAGRPVWMQPCVNLVAIFLSWLHPLAPPAEYREHDTCHDVRDGRESVPFRSSVASSFGRSRSSRGPVGGGAGAMRGRRARGACASSTTPKAPRMIGVAMRMLRRRDLAEEAAHDAFMRIWRGGARLRPGAGLSARLDLCRRCATARSPFCVTKAASKATDER